MENIKSYKILSENTFIHFLDENNIKIASTDPSLGLPAIPTTWIRDVYIPSNGSIKEVKLELEFNHALKSMATESRIKLTPNNEVVIVDRNIDKLPYPELVKEISEYYKDVKIVEKSVDQELEDAAAKTYPYHPDATKDSAMSVAANVRRTAFKAGANWKAEQVANDAIEFMQFRDDHCVMMGERLMTLFAGDGGKLYTIKELYELWQQNR